MTEQETLSSIKGKNFSVINWYFYKEEEQNEMQEIWEIFEIPNKYNIIGRCTLLGDIVVYYKNKIGVISHDEPETGPLTMIKDIVKFSEFIKVFEEYEGYADDNLEQLKKAKKQLKQLKKKAPKRLRDNFEDEIDEVKDLIDDIKTGFNLDDYKDEDEDGRYRL